MFICMCVWCVVCGCAGVRVCMYVCVCVCVCNIVEAKKEVQRNVEDSKFYASRPLLYGQAFQLRHVNSNKFLSVVFGGNLSDVHGSADVELGTGSPSDMSWA